MIVTIKISRTQLMSLLRDGGVLAGLRNTMQCLQSVRITTKNGRIRVESTDSDSHICVYGVCESSEDVSFCVNAKEITSLVGLISDEEIKMLYDADKGKISLKHTYGKASLLTTSANEFPTIKAIADGATATVSGNAVAEWLSVASDFVDTKFAGQVLENVNIYANSENIGVCGGSHHVIFTAKTQNSDNSGNFDMCIPSASAQILSKICAMYEEVSLTYGNNALLIETSACKVYTLLVDAKYPNINRLFEHQGDREVSVNKDILLKSLKRINSQIVKGSTGLRIKCIDNTLYLSYKDSLGFERDIEESVPCSGDNFSEACVDVSYFLKIVSHINADNIVFRHSDSNVAPFIFANEYEGNIELFLLAVIA